MSGKTCEAKSIGLCEWDDAAFENGTACVVEYSRQLLDQARRESCGKDVFCREGTWQVSEIIADITKGKIEGEEGELIRELLLLISENANCEMSSAAAARCLDLMDRYQNEWEQHLRRKRCTNLICKPSYLLYIAPELCDGCGKCPDSCPVGAIAGGKDMIHVIDAEACDKCGKCIEVCPRGAIKKISAHGVKPKVPAAPVAVGSFGGSGGGEEGSSMRRRRRGES